MSYKKKKSSALKKKKLHSKVWRVKNQDRDQEGGGGSAADVNMVFILPREFMASASDEEDSNLEEAMAELNLEPMPATFEMPEEEERKHLKPLFLKGHIDGRPMSRMVVDGGATVNLMPYAVFRKIGKSDNDLIKTDMMLKDYEGKISPARGALCVDLTIGSKTLPTTFFIINGKGSYNLLLGWDWIQANCCIPSTMH